MNPNFEEFRYSMGGLKCDACGFVIDDVIMRTIYVRASSHLCIGESDPVFWPLREHCLWCHKLVQPSCKMKNYYCDSWFTDCPDGCLMVMREAEL